MSLSLLAGADTQAMSTHIANFVAGLVGLEATWPFHALSMLVEKLDSVLPTTDFLVVCLPRGGTTDSILDRRRLDLLPPRAVLVNVGRGNAVDEPALVEKLANGELAGAYLDVYRDEPLLPDSPLRSCSTAFLMPHAAAISPNYLDLFLDEFVGKFRHRYGFGELNT